MGEISTVSQRSEASDRAGWLAPSRSLRTGTLLSLFFAGLFLLIFGRMVFDSVWIFGSTDVWLYHGPNQYFLDCAIRDGHLPRWNPLILCGMPFAANPQVMAFYPPNLLRSVLNPGTTPLATHISFALLIGFHFVLLGTSTYFLARQQGCGKRASFVAALGLVCSGACVARAFIHPNFLFAVTWLPLQSIMLLRCAHTSHTLARYRWAVAAGLVFGVQLLVGYPLHVVYATPAYLVLIVGACVLSLESEDTGMTRFRAAAKRGATGGLAPFGVMVLVGGLLAAAMLLPGRELASFGQRAKALGAASSGIEKTLFDISLVQGLQLALFYGERTITERLMMVREMLSGLSSLRTGMALAMLAVFAHQARHARLLFGAMLYVLVDLCLGYPFPVSVVAQRLTPFDFGHTAHGSILIGAPLAILAALGIDALLRREEHAPGGRARTAWAIVGAVLVFALLFPLPGSGTRAGLVAMAMPVLLCLLLLLRRPWPRQVQVLFVALLVAECLWWSAAYLPTPKEALGHGNALGHLRADRLREPAAFSTDNARSLCDLGNTGMYALDGAVNGYDPLLLAKANRVISRAEAEGDYHRILWAQNASMNPWTALFLKRPFWLACEFARGSLPAKGVLFPPTRTAYFEEESPPGIPEIARKRVFARSIAVEGPVTHLWGNGGPAAGGEERGETRLGLNHRVFSYEGLKLPALHSALRFQYRSATAAEVTAVTRNTATGERFILGPFPIPASPGKETESEWPLPDFTDLDLTVDIALKEANEEFRLSEMYIAHDAADENGLIEIAEWTADAVRVRLRDLPGPRVLVFTDMAYPGWRATLDSEETPILVANDAFKAIVVPSGTHEVCFEFHSSRVDKGMGISVATLGGALVFLLSGIGRSRKREEHDN